jgi:hypothetical protein
MTQQPGPEVEGDVPTGPPFPSYEELASDVLESLDGTGLSIEDVRHEVEPGIGERRFECTIRLSPADPPSRYHAHLSFSWDALLTYVTAFGPGADCELYHDDEEAADCPHQTLAPQPFVELQVEFVLGDGGYELQDVGEVTDWVSTVQGLLSKAFTGEDRPSVHIGLAALGPTVLVEKFTAEHSWLIDFERAPDLAGISKQIQAALKLIPALADRLPI